MASSVNKRKCYSTEEVLQFFQGSEEDDETEEYALEDMEGYSDSESQDSEGIDTESVGDLCEIGPEIVRIDHPEDQSRIEAPGQASLVPASTSERQVNFLRNIATSRIRLETANLWNVYIYNVLCLYFHL